MKKSLMLLSALMVVGCASQPVPPDQAISVPADRVVDSSMLSPAPGLAKVVVIRDNGTFIAAASELYLSVDGHNVAAFKPAERLELWIAPGEHVFSVTNWASKVSGTSTLSVVADPIKTKNIRIGAKVSAITIEPIVF